MNDKSFDAFLQEKLHVTRQVLASKGTEYATDAAAVLHANTPAIVGWHYLTKHIVSCQDIVFAAEDFKSTPIAQINEKFGDAINYLFLVWAMLSETNEQCQS